MRLRDLRPLKLVARGGSATPFADTAPPWQPAVPSAGDAARPCLNSAVSGRKRWPVARSCSRQVLGLGEDSRRDERRSARRPDLVAFQMRAKRSGKGRYSCSPFSRSPVLGSGINPYSQPGTNSSREQVKAAAARPAPAAGPKPTPSRFYPGVELLAGQYRRCSGFASFDALQRQALPRFQIGASTRWFARDLKFLANLQPS